jgi:hypothetical protein
VPLSAAFANDWQWLFGFPVLAAILSLAKHWFGKGSVSLNTDTALGALEAAGAAFIITLVIGFFIHLFSSASKFYYEERERADILQQHIDLVISPRAKAKEMLHQCYIEICDLFDKPVREEDIDQYRKCYDETLMNQAIRIENELGVAARVKLFDQIGINNSRFRKARGNTDYNDILMSIHRTKENLEDLIKTDFWNQTPM